MDTQTIYRQLEFLHPKFQVRCRDLHQRLIRAHETGVTQFRFEIFETFRSPVRQLHLKAEGVSKAGAWQSAHQYGLAADFVPKLDTRLANKLGVKPGWYWPEVTDPAWQVLKTCAAEAGLVQPISWDKPHVEHPMFDDLFQLLFK